MISRRKLLGGMAAAGAYGLGMQSPASLFASAPLDKPKIKRVVFFLQNNGFREGTCWPDEVTDPCKLSEFTLARHMSPLEPYKDKMQIITGLHGKHCSPGHSSFFGALGGYRGAMGTAPAGPTIDVMMSRALPQTILPHLGIGFDSLSFMKSDPAVARLSAAGAGKPIYMHSDPVLLYQSIFGAIASGDMKNQYKSQNNILKKMEHFESRIAKRLPHSDQARYATYTDGLRDMNAVREQLAGMSEKLKQYAPIVDERYAEPEFETDWHHCLLEIGISALQSGLTNVLTVGSGRAHYSGTYEGIGVLNQQGHSIGHLNQMESEHWLKIRQYNCEMMIKVMKALETVPEGDGTMMDNTLIVYTSDAANSHHSSGKNWPFVLLGNGGGHFKTGQFAHCGGRPINDLYATFLRGVGAPVDRFNVEASMVNKLESGLGPIEGILA